MIELETIEPTRFLGLFKWSTLQEIEPMILPVNRSLYFDLGVSPSYQVTNLPEGIELKLLTRMIHGQPSTESVALGPQISEIYLKAWSGDIVDTYQFVWYVY